MHESGLYISLAVYFIAMLGIGVYAYLKTDNDVSGFMLGGRQLSPSVTALSAGASDMSGWMLMGLPGALYLTGVSATWIAFGLVMGAYLNYLLVAPRLRAYTHLADDSVTIPEYFARRFNDNTKLISTLCGLVIVLFFTIYTTAGVVAGGKLFESSFGLSYQFGLWVTVGVVVAYSTFGGFLAVSTTDFVQGCIMFVALIMVPIVALTDIGGVSAAQAELNRIDPALLSLTSGGALALISSLAWGLGYFGQPHIIVRFMAIRSVKDVPMARRIGMSWMIVTLIGSCAVGLVGAAWISANGMKLDDPETIFIFFSTTLFHPLVGGFLLAAILAAIMSTISSQLLVTASSLTQDIYNAFLRKNASPAELVMVSRLSIVAVALVAIMLAQDRDNTVLSLVSNAWAGFGAAFGPVVLLSLYWGQMNWQGALAGIVGGSVTVIFWLFAPITIDGLSLSQHLYEIVPGFIVSLLSIVLVTKLTKGADPILQERHEALERLMAQ